MICYHGTRQEAAFSIRQYGLRPSKARYSISAVGYVYVAIEPQVAIMMALPYGDRGAVVKFDVPERLVKRFELDPDTKRTSFRFKGTIPARYIAGVYFRYFGFKLNEMLGRDFGPIAQMDRAHVS